MEELIQLTDDMTEREQIKILIDNQIKTLGQNNEVIDKIIQYQDAMDQILDVIAKDNDMSAETFKKISGIVKALCKEI